MACIFFRVSSFVCVKTPCGACIGAYVSFSKGHILYSPTSAHSWLCCCCCRFAVEHPFRKSFSPLESRIPFLFLLTTKARAHAGSRANATYEKCLLRIVRWISHGLPLK